MKLIRRIFIKDYLNVNNPKVREKHGILASVGGLITNIILFAFKLSVGILSFSMSIISDALNNLTDFFSCFVNIFGFKIAYKPADKRHPYGHERVEYISGMIIALAMVSLAVVLGYTSITKLINQDGIVAFSIFSFIVLGISIIIKVLLGLFYYSIGKAIDSESLKAAMIDSFNDAICTLGVLIAALINHYVEGLWWLDPSISLCIAIFILYSGIKTVCETASPLIGVSPNSEFIKNITNDILKYDCVLGIHDLTCHTYGHTKIFVTVHCEVDGYQNIMTIHDKIDVIEHDIANKYGVEITIHIDPVDVKNPLLATLKEQIANILGAINQELEFHDLRMVKKNNTINVLFDVVTTDNIRLSDQDLKNKISNKVKQLDERYYPIIKIDHKY